MINDTPLDYSAHMMNGYFNTQPSSVQGQNNGTTNFYKRQLYNLIYSLYDFNIPKDWNLGYFRYWLFHYGSLGVIYTKEFGWICQPYSVVKLDLYYQPKVIQIYNQFIKDAKVGIIGENAGIVKCFDDYFGFDDIVHHYAEKLANCDKSIDISLMNANVSVIAEVENKKEADAMKEAYGRATTGEPLVTINKNVLNNNGLNTLLSNPKNNFIASDVQVLKRSIVNEFLTRIGIRNANFDKKERMNSQEVSENNDETKAICDVVFENIKESFDRINAFSGLGLGIEYHFDYETEVLDNDGQNNIDGNV